MFIRKGQKLGSVLVEKAGTESTPEPKSKEAPKKQTPAKKTPPVKAGETATKAEPAGESTGDGWDLSSKSEKTDGDH